MFLRLKISDAAAKIATSVRPRRVRALEAGEVRHQRRVAGRRAGAVMPAQTSAASAICGTHFGLTNADTSITGKRGGRQAIDEGRSCPRSRSGAGSFCRPSRGPTSTTVTPIGGPLGAHPLDLDQGDARLHELAFRAGDRA